MLSTLAIFKPIVEHYHSTGPRTPENHYPEPVLKRVPTNQPVLLLHIM